ncbi:aldolase/citrate lyase family protein [Spiroplasma endosymbiont of Aspidapion aeneum]|uniref:aldolase/citrate lyase family protein n=1 Tax=Spiroplasma endosymbiont of Aspidapion aeneum TaxID=3066276 RepID=UPI00313AEF73
MKGWKRTTTRKHMLFVPADKPAMYRDVIFYKPDTIMFDLEDAISFSEKNSTRILLNQMLQTIDYNTYGIEVCARVNGLDTQWFEEDVKAVINGGVNMIRLPKVESKEDIIAAIAVMEKYEKEFSKDETLIFVAIESAKGVLNANEIVQASKRVVGIALGGMDYLLDLKAEKLPDRTELLYARQHLVHVARANKIDAFDLLFSNTTDDEGFIKEFKFIKALGFTGKSVIHPNQIGLINEVYKPTSKQIEYALEMKKAFDESIKKGVGVFLFRGNMVDKPVIEKQLEIIDLAIEFGLISKGDIK